jgi:hypothetical protein
VKAGKAASGKKAGKGRTAKALKQGRSVKRVKQVKPVKQIKQDKPLKRDKQVAADQPVGRVVVRELDPQQKCGEGTSVQFLYRVDHTVDGHRTAHLVFFDPHGWYCEHGRTCPAVAHAKKHNGQFARVS